MTTESEVLIEQIKDAITARATGGIIAAMNSAAEQLMSPEQYRAFKVRVMQLMQSNFQRAPDAPKH